MKKKLYLCVFLSFILVVVACASKNLWKSKPNLQQASNEYFVATISPIYTFNAYKGFILTIHNKTSDSIEIDWSNTFYVYAGQKEGGFWFEGIPYKDKKKPVPPDMITGVIFTKEIYPEKLITLSQLAGAYVHEEMKSGENGVQLTVKIDGKPITEMLTLNFSEE
ncbi:hypothetical protein ACFLZE_04160 [Thermodesulfobacteriota bacterium]